MEQLSFDDLEAWRPVPGYEGLYEVSSRGRVKSLPRNTTRGGIMKLQHGNAQGYHSVGLYKCDVRTVHYVHYLVLLAFVGPRPDGLEVRHLDGDDLNNVLANLAYGTSGENKADMLRHGRHHFGSRTHCDNGHEFTPENTTIQLHPDGSFHRRVCRACTRDKSKLSEQHRKAVAPPCTRDECGRPQIAKGLCRNHYNQQRARILREQREAA